MKELIEKIPKTINILPDPTNLAKVVGKIQESINKFGFDEVKQLLLSDYLYM